MVWQASFGHFRSLDGVTGIDDNLSTSTSLGQKNRDEFQRKADRNSKAFVLVYVCAVGGTRNAAGILVYRRRSDS